jgi:hypothetical protein
MDATDIDEQTREAEIEAITQVVATHPDPGPCATSTSAPAARAASALHVADRLQPQDVALVRSSDQVGGHAHVE